MNAPTAVQKAPVDPAIGAAIEVYERLNVIRNVLAPDLNDQELQLFAIVAERSRLDPFAKQIYAIKRGGRVTFQTGIDGFRSSAEDTGEYRGSDEPEFGPDITEGSLTHPEWARVIVHREFANGKTLSQPAVAYWNEFYPGSGDNGAMYRKMPRNQLAKCAEAAAFRKAFPKRFSDVYTPEEMAQADAVELAKPVGPTARERVAQRRAEIESGASAEGPKSPADSAESDVVEGETTEPELFGGPMPARPARGRAKPTGDDIVTRLKRVFYANQDKADKPSTDEQKDQLRELFTGVQPTSLAPLLAQAFGQELAEDERFHLNRAEAQALLEVGLIDREAFLLEMAAIAQAAQQ